MMMHESWSSTAAPTCIRPLSKSAPCSPIKPVPAARTDAFHVAHKVPVGDTPYVRAKQVQLVDKDPEKAIALFWAAINAGDRVDSALKDMAIVMKQQNRAEEAIEAIKSLRGRCSDQAQESLDNILLDLYKRCGRLDDQIALLKHKLQLIQKGLAFNGKRTKTARSQGRKFQVTLEQEATRLLGNLGWALMQKENYAEAEAAYRRALQIGTDSNKVCNLGICLMKQGRIAEAKETLKQVRPAAADSLRGADSHLKAFERAQEMLRDLEAKLSCRASGGQSWLFLGSSIWQPQPCVDYLIMPPPPQSAKSLFADENTNNLNRAAALNIDAPPFFSSKLVKPLNHDALANLKRTRSCNTVDMAAAAAAVQEEAAAATRWPELPDSKEFDEAIVAALLGPVLEEERNRGGSTLGSNNINKSPGLCEQKMGKRLRIFQDITQDMNSPK
ncbi:protein POLLENLESS 3-LIKE 2 isoform X2 [Zingiber officinale]|uniref:protein POLLENLESS 3-LIKE 2 isoform X2 n=1 Tax=Zingiber officinale TaxID=94328 RepID=UPI001C4BBC0A|nr:protein POLLENLESS 3-LIKE 2 isoform X2 [Zingiber officinale]